MAHSVEIPFSPAEKLFILAEIVKDAQVPPDTLLNVVADFKIEPRWNDIALPAGRSLRSCQTAYQQLLLSSAHPASGVMLQGTYAYAGPPAMVAPTSGRKRKEPASRTLQPRPSAAFHALNGDQSSLLQMTPGSEAGQPPRKKRGRPSRAEIEARAAAAAARGEPYPPVKTPRTPKAAKKAGRASVGAGAAADASDPAVAAAGSVVKKRRGRPTKAELEAKSRLTQAGFLNVPDNQAGAGQAMQDMDEDAAADTDAAVAGLVEETPDMSGGAGGIDGVVPDMTHMGGSAEVQSSATL